jgi:hypothetical protein
VPDLYQATQQHKALAQAVREALGDDETAIAMVAALQAAQECGIAKIKAPDFTASVGKSQGKVVIVDEERLPNQAFRTKREINRSWIRDQLLTGVDVAGAELSNGETHWTVRTV